jgi:hypothetical protein
MRPVSDLLPVFRKCGFVLHDDVVSLDRSGTIPPWQHSSIAEVEVLCNEQELFGFDDGVWNTIRLKYLFATLPFELAERFSATAFELNRELDTTVHFHGTVASIGDLNYNFALYREEVLNTTGVDVGTEGIAIAIQETYPRPANQ